VRELQGEKAAAAARAAAAESSLQEVTRVEGELRRQVGAWGLCWYGAVAVLCCVLGRVPGLVLLVYGASGGSQDVPLPNMHLV
jgi:hypothetical protein